MYNGNKLSFYDELQVLEPKEDRLSKEERLLAMKRPLLSWYAANARNLPWRENTDPYRVWISEIMLQQTRVEAVKPYFERFMTALPEVRNLAVVPEDELLKLWEGLGYYSRARNLKKAAQIVVEEFGGKLPESYEELLRLPGIGSYTAGAIASIAYGLPVPAVDGNVLRVISRVLGSRAEIDRQAVKKRMEEDLKMVIPKDAAGSFNQGLIEVGAMVCVPNGEPLCRECPFYSICLAEKDGLTHEIPVKSPKKPRRIEEKTIFLFEYQGQTAIRKREDAGLLASLYELPNEEGFLTEEEVCRRLGVDMDQVERLDAAKHIFSHVEWHMIGYRISLTGMIPGDYLWVTPLEMQKKYSLPGAFKMYTKMIR